MEFLDPFLQVSKSEFRFRSSADPEGRTGGPDPPGKSQVIWVSIGNKQLDPPRKSWTPPPLENVGPPLEPWKMIDFFEIDHLTSVKKS